MYKKLIIIAAVILIIEPLSFGNYSGNYINWQKGYIISKGSASITVDRYGITKNFHTGGRISVSKARMEAYSRARDEAVLNIVALLKTVRIDPAKTIDDIIIEEQEVQKRLTEKLVSSLKIREYPLDFFSTACEAKLKFSDIITTLPLDFPENNFPVRQHIPVSTYYSGIIIDTRGLDVEPMLLPSVFDENGLEIYGRQFIDGTLMLEGGMVSYCFDESEASSEKRAGVNPYFTVALKRLKGCPVISNKDSKRILSHPGTLENLKQCRVVFIIDK